MSQNSLDHRMQGAWFVLMHVEQIYSKCDCKDEESKLEKNGKNVVKHQGVNFLNVDRARFEFINSACNTVKDPAEHELKKSKLKEENMKCFWGEILDFVMNFVLRVFSQNQTVNSHTYSH